MKRLAGERRAIAATVLVFYGFLYLAVALTAGPPLGRMFGAIAGVYGLAFFAITAGYFWARWFALGVSLFGVIQGGVMVWQLGADVLPLFFLCTHLAAAGALWGDSVRALFDGRTNWRERWSMDEAAVNRLGNAITRAGVSLPFVLIYALAPRADGAALLAGGLAVAGTWGLVRMRGWSVLGLAGGAVALGVGALCTLQAGALPFAPMSDVSVPVWLVAGVGAGLVSWAIAALARPILARLSI